MSESTFDRATLGRLLAKLIDDVLTDADQARLESLLKAHPAARQHYFQYVDLHAELAARLDRAPLAHGVDLMNGVAASAQATKLPLLSRLASASVWTNRPLAWSVCACGLVFCAYLGVLFWGLRDRTLPTGTDGNATIVATITGSDNAEWSSTSVSPRPASGRGPGGEGQDIAKGRSLAITSGLVELQLSQGATLLIEGPAEWTIDGANEATLKSGKVLANVPAQAIGFTLHTPTASIIDLGTEFQTEVAPNGATKVQVLQGKVDVEHAPTSGKLPAKRRVTAGEGVQVNSTGFAGEIVSGGDPIPSIRRPVARGEGPVMIEQGGTFAENNLARGPHAKAFAIDCFKDRPGDWQVDISYLNDGRYGNRYSWIGNKLTPAFAGVSLGEQFTIDSIAFGRDNGGDDVDDGDNQDRCGGEYTLQVTVVKNPDATTPDSAWRTIGTITHPTQDIEIKSGTFKPYLRHRYRFTPTEATGVRVLVPSTGNLNDGTCIDEIEVYPPTAEIAAPKAAQP